MELDREGGMSCKIAVRPTRLGCSVAAWHLHTAWDRAPRLRTANYENSAGVFGMCELKCSFRPSLVPQKLALATV